MFRQEGKPEMAKQKNVATATHESESNEMAKHETQTQETQADEFSTLFGNESPSESAHNGNGAHSGAALTDLEREIQALKLQLAAKDAIIAKRAERAGTSATQRVRQTLETTIARQSDNPLTWAILGIGGYVQQRVAMGQSEAEAFDQVIEQVRATAEAVLAEKPAKLMPAVSAYVKAHFPNAVLTRYATKGAAAKSGESKATSETADESPSAFEDALAAN